jgi:HEAT repeat protein
MRPTLLSAPCALLALCALCVPARAQEAPRLRALQRAEINALEVSDTAPTRAGRAYEPAALLDGVLWSAWSSARGEGAWVTLRFPMARYVRRLQLLVGDAADGRTWKRSGRPRRLRVHHDGGAVEVVLEDSRNLQEVDFPDPIVSTWLRLEVLEVTGGGPAAISELQVFEPEDVFALKPGLRQEIEAQVQGLRDPSRRDAASARLEGIGAPAMAWLVPLLGDPDLGLRAAATELMAKTRTAQVAPRVREQLERLFEDPKTLGDEAQWRYAQVALRYLGVVQDGLAVPLALKMLRQAAWEETLGEELIGLLASSGDPAALPALEGALRRGGGQAAAAAPGFARLGVEGGQRLARLAGHPDRELRLRASAALAGFRERWPEEAAARFLRDEDPEIRASALDHLGLAGHLRALSPLLEASVDPNGGVRRACARALGGYGAPEATARLRALALDPDPEVRAAALESLERQGEVALPALLGLLEEGDPRDAEALDEALGRLARRHPEAALAALRALARGVDQHQGQRAANLMARCGPAGLEALFAMMAGEDSRESFYARRALERSARDASPLLKRALRPDAAAQMEPALLSRYLSIAAASQDPALLDVLAPLAADSRARVRGEVMRTLRSFPYRGAHALLLAGLEDPWREAREQAAMAVGEQRLREAIPALAALIKRQDPASPRAIWALGQIGDPAALPALYELLVHQRPLWRQYACAALGQIGDPDAEDPLHIALEDEDEMVRFQARRALRRLRYPLSRR